MMHKKAIPGTVYLVGAGPGDPSLLTVRGLVLLRQADVVIYDRLVHPDLLEECSPHAERLFVGKEAGFHACCQEDIGTMLVRKAQAKKVVIRLKGGDPFVFGRGGEEAALLAASGVPFEVVPGISSAIAVPAYAGIPVTHRGQAQAFTVVTGHTGGEDLLEWASLARTGTLVILMGLAKLSEIQGRLLDHGLSPEMPVAVIRCGTTEQQEVVEGTLRDIGEKAAGIRSPAVIVVGEVVRLRSSLSWFDPVHLTLHDFPSAIPASLATRSALALSS